MSATVEQILEELKRVRESDLPKAAAAQTEDEVKAIERELLGKKSAWKSASESIKSLDPADRPAMGQALSQHRAEVTAVIADRLEAIAAEQQQSGASRIDLTVVAPGSKRGHVHPVTQVANELMDIFLGMGYSIAEGPEIETDWYNFEALNVPKSHPARDMQDTMYVDRGAPKSSVMRTQTSNVQIRTMLSGPPPVYVVAPGRVFRQEATDARHSPVFHQIEGLAVDEGITLGDMFGVIKTFVGALFGDGIQTRFQPSYFPFTEPSAEFAAQCVFCAGDGCRVCSKTGWIELGGCGMVDPNVFEAVGYDPEQVSGFAFGFGLERIAMLRHDIDTIGSLFTNDVRFLGQF